MLLAEHRGERGLVMVGTDIDYQTFYRMERAELVQQDAGEPGRWCRLTAAGIIEATKAEQRGAMQFEVKFNQKDIEAAIREHARKASAQGMVPDTVTIEIRRGSSGDMREPGSPDSIAATVTMKQDTTPSYAGSNEK